MKKFNLAYFRVPIVFVIIFGAIEYFVDSGDQPAFVKYPIILLVLSILLFVHIAIEIMITAVDNVLYHLLSPEEKQKHDAALQLPMRESTWYKNLMKRLTKAEPLENQAIVLNHDYDGIKELDNNLPPWWVYLFYGTIAFAAIYLVRYELMGGDNPDMEFRKEMAAARIAVEEYKKNAPDLMDEKTVVQLTAPAELAIGKTIFETNCAACHRADGGGQIGPNLTDDYWILGGGIKNLFHTVTNGGRDGKGMVAWRGTLKPKEIQHVASYILSLRGSNPKDPKAPDGEIWQDKAENIKGTASTVTK